MNTKTIVGLVLLLVGLSAIPVHAQDAQGTRRPKLVVTDTSGNVTTLQPTAGLNDGTDDGSATKGKDTYSWGACGPVGILNGDGQVCSTLTSTCNDCTGSAFLQFSLADMPTINIASAQIQVYTGVAHWGCGWPFPADPIFGLRQVTSDWNEMTLSAAFQPTVNPTPIASHVFPGVAGLGGWWFAWVSYDITDLYKGWADGTIPNYGVRVSQDNSQCANCIAAWFYSSDDGLTKVTYTGPTSGTYPNSATVSAILRDYYDPATGFPGIGPVVVGRILSFTVGTQSCTGVTNAAGQASCVLTPSGAGIQPITVSFAGDSEYQASTTTAQFEVIGGIVTYTITASAGPNGSIAPSGAVTVNSGGSQVFSIVPSVGYHIANVLVDGVAVGALSSYTFSGVTANHTISASFAIDTTPNPYDSLRAVLNGCVTNKGILNSLTAKLNNAEAAEQRGNLNAKAGMIGAFVNEVQAQTGKAVDRTCAAELIRLAQLL
ncbi:MAG: Ig-like domain repeat protein [candidate division NC10 bacterium]|nr:Ig-like domain repeat protein [candidate division NC10 bacterium]